MSRIELKVDNTQRKQLSLELKLNMMYLNNVQILFKAQEGTQEHLGDMKDQLKDIKNEIVKHDIKIQVIEGKKKKKILIKLKNVLLVNRKRRIESRRTLGCCSRPCPRRKADGQAVYCQ